MATMHTATRITPHDPIGQRSGLAGFALFALLFLVACALSGCHVLTDAQRKTIATNAAAGRADVREWDGMTPAQQKAAIVSSTASWVALDYPVNGNDPGPEWRAVLDAPKATKDAETPRCSNVEPGGLRVEHVLEPTGDDRGHRWCHPDGSACHAFCPSTCPETDK